MSKTFATRRQFLRTIALGVPAAGLCAGTANAAVVKQPLPRVSLDFVKSGIELHRREAWTDFSPRPWRMRHAGRFHRLTVHHSGASVNYSTAINSVIADLRAVLAGHTGRNYGDIGYHFAIDHAGRVWEARSLAYEGAHVAGNNEGNIGIMVLGNYEHQSPTDKQIVCINRMAELLRLRYGVKYHRVYGHRDLGASACPGRNLYPVVARLRA